MREERIRHEELIRQHEAATKIQAAQRGKQERRRARSRMTSRRQNEQPKSKRVKKPASPTATSRSMQKTRNLRSDDTIVFLASDASTSEGLEERSAATKIQAVHRGRRCRQQKRTGLSRRKRERPTEKESKSMMDVAAFKAALARYDREFEPQASLRERQRQEAAESQRKEEEERLLKAAQAAATRRERSRRLQLAARRAKMLARLYNPEPLNVAAFEERRTRYTEALEAALAEITSLELPVCQSIRESFEISSESAAKLVPVQQQQGELLQQMQQSDSTQTHMSLRLQQQSAVADCINEMIRVTEEQAEAGAPDLDLS